MRPKFVIALLVVAGIISAGAFFLKRHLSSAVPPAAVPVVTTAPESPAKDLSANLQPLPQPPPLPAPAPVPAPAPAPTLSPEDQIAAINAEVERLRLAGLSDNPADLQIILADLNNPEKEIREAAISAAKQFGSTNAIPALLTAATNTADPAEKIELLDAANFVALPSISLNSNPTPKTPEELQAIKDQVFQSQQARQAKMQKRMHVSGQDSAAPADPNAAPPAGGQ